MAEINPDCRVHVREDWFTLDEGHAVLAGEASAAAAARQAAGGVGAPGGFAVLDAIDSYVEKYIMLTNPSSHPAPIQLPPSSPPISRCAITEACIRLGVHVAVAGASGGRADPSCVRVSDLTCTSRDPLLAAVRRSLRTEHGFPLGPPGGTRAPPPWGVPAVYSIEEVAPPLPQPADLTASGSFSNCEARFGTAGFVTGSFGLACASVLTKLVCHTGLEPQTSRPQAALLLTRFEPRLGQLATDAPLPDGRAAVAAALPPQGSIARPIAQRIAERRPGPRAAAPRTPPPPAMRLGGRPERHGAPRGAPRVVPGRAWASLGRPLRSPPPPRMLLPRPGLPFFAPPPTPASLLASTAELILRAKLQQVRYLVITP